MGSPPRPLPDFIPPMLARGGAEPFDAEDHLFEVKWDGFRAQSIVKEGGSWRLISRRENPLHQQFPELDGLAALPAGTIVDGEIVILKDGKPDFESLLTRQRVATGRQTAEAQLVAFDLLYERGESLLNLPLAERRTRLTALLEHDAAGPRVVLSDGVVGRGKAFAEAVFEQELEGVVAKRLDSTYRPGERSDAWRKIKRTHIVQCVVIGYVEKERDLRSLVLATERDGTLRHVGRVGSGMRHDLRAELLPRLRELHRDGPLVPCDDPGAVFVHPRVFCSVRFFEWTGPGHLRAPVFDSLIDES